jgi:hypothetical protein
MGLCVEKLIGKPMLVMSFDATTTAREVVEAHFMSLELARHISGPVHHIVNLLDTGCAYPLIVFALGDLLQARAIHNPDLQLYVYVIGAEYTDWFTIRSLIPFTSLDEGVAFIEQQVSLLVMPDSPT